MGREKALGRVRGLDRIGLVYQQFFLLRSASTIFCPLGITCNIACCIFHVASETLTMRFATISAWPIGRICQEFKTVQQGSSTPAQQESTED